jgi:hypothetical protein
MWRVHHGDEVEAHIIRNGPDVDDVRPPGSMGLSFASRLPLSITNDLEISS